MQPTIPALARALLRRRPPPVPAPNPALAIRALSTPTARRKWEGRPASEHAAREQDAHNVQHDAVKEGKEERERASSGEEGSPSSRGTSERDGGSAERARREFPEARDTIGMQDERGGKS